MIRKRQKQIDAAGKIAGVQEMLEKPKSLSMTMQTSTSGFRSGSWHAMHQKYNFQIHHDQREYVSWFWRQGVHGDA